MCHILNHKLKSVLIIIRRKRIDRICKIDSLYRGDHRRYKLFKHMLAEIGDNCLIRSGIIVHFPENISIGNNVSIQENCYMSGYGGITIGNDVSVGNGSKIVSSEHIYSGGGGYKKSTFNRKTCYHRE